MPAERVIAADNVRDVAEALRGALQPGDVVYLKGSLMRHLERVRLILDGEEVGCTVISCPFYHQCNTCRYLKTGYTPPSHS